MNVIIKLRLKSLICIRPTQCLLITQVFTTDYNRGREPMTREPDVALLITASGSFVAKHKLPHIKEKDLRTQDFKSEDPFLRDYYNFKTKIQQSELD